MKRKIMHLSNALRFKKFQRKPYSVFNSLNQVVHIAVLPLMCLTFAHTSNVLAQTSNLQNIEHNLQEIEVMGKNASDLTGRQSGLLFVIEKDEIAAAPIQNLQDLLEYVGSVDVRQRGGNGVQADVSIRGGSFDQVLVLLNGVNITDPQTGHHSLNIPLDLSSISRIEVLEGSASRVLGATPFSGAINIITGETKQNEANAELTAGDYGYVSQNINATLASQFLNNFVSVSRQRSSGYTDNTDFDLKNAYIQSIYSSKKSGKIQLQLAYQDKAFGANSFYSFTYPNQFEQTKTFFSSLSWDKKITKKTNLTVQTYWREFHDRFELFRDMQDAPSFYTGHNYHQTDILGAQSKLVHFSSLGKTTIGIDFRNEHIFSNVLGETMTDTRNVPFESGAVFTKEKNRSLLNGFADHVFYLNKFSLGAGLAANYSNDYDTQFSGGVDLNYLILNGLDFYVNANRAYRLPTFTDLYYKSATQIANPNLKPEESTVFEGGLKYQKNGLNIKSDVYYRMGKNVIDWIKLPDSTKWESHNLSDVNALGADFSFDYRFKKLFVKKIQLTYSYLQLDKNAGEYDSKYALDYLKHKISVGINHRVYKNISMNWNFIWQDRAGDYTDFYTTQKVSYQPFFLTDVGLQWNNNKIAVFADVNNLFDKKYADFGGLIQSGRWVKTGIRVKI